MATIEEVNNRLIETVHEVLKIQQEGKAQRQKAEGELLRIEENLKNTLVSASKHSLYTEDVRVEKNVTPPKN